MLFITIGKGICWPGKAVREMKKLIIVLQILVLLSQSVRADDTRLSAVSAVSADSATTTPLEQMPKNYKLPDMILLDSIAFYNQFRDQAGKRVSVQGFTGRFGSTFGEDFKSKIFELEKSNESKIEIILTLSSTREDAKVYRDKLATMGRKAIIVDIPDEVQKDFIARADAKAQGGLKELWWDVKDKTKKIYHLDKTISDTKKIIRHQFVKPNHEDLDLMYLSLKVTGLTAVGLLFVGVDPSLVLSMAAARAVIGGSTMAFHRTISNIFKTDITHDLSIVSTPRRTITRLLTMGLGFSEAYYAIGTHLSPTYGITQEQILSNTVTSGVIETAAAEERNNRLSALATTRMIRYTIMLGAALSTFSMTGTTGPLVIEQGIFQISLLQSITLAIFGASFLMYKYKSDKVEKFAQAGFLETLRKKLARVANIQAAREERELKEKQQAEDNRSRVIRVLEETRANNRARTQQVRIKMCVSLFK